MPAHAPMTSLPAHGILKALAEIPVDLTKPGILYPDRIKKFVCQGAGFSLYYATQQIDDNILDILQSLADQSQVIDQFMAMKKGAVINKIDGFESENRQVLHTATRDLFGSQALEPKATAQAREELEKLTKFIENLDNGTISNHRGEAFTDLVNVGIGGSDLGPRAIYLALAGDKSRQRRVHFIANVDPDDAATVLEGLDLSRTMVNVVSKSGTTLETLTNEKLVRTAFLKAGLDPKNHFLAVTGQGSPMENPADYCQTFSMFDYIGGRYSTTSMVGGVMLGFALGMDGFMAILKGANAMDQAAEERNIRRNMPLLLALLGIWNRNFLNHETLAILPYSQALHRFSAHLQQCDMESNGKSITRQGENVSYGTGPVIWGEAGTNGQHAFYQLLHQGNVIVPVEFIGFRRSQRGKDLEVNATTSQEKLTANLLAQSIAMAKGQQHENPNKFFAGNRPNSIIMADQLTPESMGALLALYENKVAFQGFLWNINSFDQEGVQLGKVLANQLLDHFTALRNNPAYDGQTKDPLGWTMMKTTGLI